MFDNSVVLVTGGTGSFGNVVSRFFLNNSGVKGGTSYSSYCGLCFETQHHTNAVNIPEFPSTILRPGELYSRQTSYKVSNS
jgi:aldose 1-epimerase